MPGAQPVMSAASAGSHAASGKESPPSRPPIGVKRERTAPSRDSDMFSDDSPQTAGSGRPPLSSDSRRTDGTANSTVHNQDGVSPARQPFKPNRKVNIDIYRDDDDSPPRAQHRPVTPGGSPPRVPRAEIPRNSAGSQNPPVIRAGAAPVMNPPIGNAGQAGFQAPHKAPHNSVAQPPAPYAPAGLTSQRSGTIGGGVNTPPGNDRAPSTGHTAVSAKTGQSHHSSPSAAGSEARRNSQAAVHQATDVERQIPGGAQYRITENTLQKVDAHHSRLSSAILMKESGQPGFARQIQRQSGPYLHGERPPKSNLPGNALPGDSRQNNKPPTRRRGP
jgi:hypothetical protein